MKYCKKILACVLCLMMVCTFAFSCFAAEVEVEGCELSVTFQEVESAQFQLYRVGEASEDGKLTLTGSYADYPVELNVTTNEAYQTAADTLWGYILRDGLEADYTAETDENGVAKFSDLSDGLYLIGGQSIETEKGTYVLSAQLWSLPYRANTADEFTYSVSASPKFTFTEIPPSKLTVKVLKVWDDKGNEEERPQSVTVKLLKSGTVVESVVLNAANNWRYTWEDLESGDWTVVEDAVEGYTVKVTQEGVTYVVTNTYVPEETQPTEPEETTKPTEPEVTTQPTTPSETIPKTGLLWWPVPVLLIAGLALIVVGTLSHRKDRNER